MITTNGKVYIKRYLAQQVPAIAQAIAFGIGSASETVNDASLQFELNRSDISLTSYDFVNDVLVFKADIPDDLAGTIYEIGLYSAMYNPIAGLYGSKVLTSFDSATESWTNSGGASSFSSTSTRIGTDSLHQAPAASATATDTLNNVSLDISGNPGSDLFMISFNAGSNVASISVLFMTDASNYYTVTVNAPAAGYNIANVAKSTATVTGTPDWSNITQIQVQTTATSGGSAAVDFDGVRVEHVDATNTEYVLVAREVLSTPFLVTAGMTQEVEFSLGTNIS